MIPNNQSIIPTGFPLLTKECREILFLAGKNRAEAKDCLIEAQDDVSAVSYWLNEYKATRTTYNAYRKESQRLLLWCAIEIKKPLSALTRDDFEMYCHFLLNPQPHAVWCGPKTSKIELWRPFVKGLSPSALSTALSIINSMMQYLVQAGYLSKNPLELIRKKSSFNQDTARKIKSLERKLELDEIHALLQTIEELPADSDKKIFYKNRLRFLVTLLILTGLRIHEVIEHPWNAFRQVQGRWWLFVIGKGNKPRHIPVNDELLQAIKFYRQSLDKLPYPLSDDSSPIISNFKETKALTQRHINTMLHKLGASTATKFVDMPDRDKRLAKLSAHTFRHINALLQDLSGISLTHIRDNLGHSNITTTNIYLHSPDIVRHQELQRISLKMQKKEEDIIYRVAVPSDAESIAKVHVKTWQIAYKNMISDEFLQTFTIARKTKMWQKILSEGTSNNYVAHKNDVIGFISFGKIRELTDTDTDTTAEIYALYVDPDFWRIGIGEELLQLALTDLKSNNYTHVLLYVLNVNTAAQAFYKNNGFLKTKKEKIVELSPGIKISEFKFTLEL